MEDLGLPARVTVSWQGRLAPWGVGGLVFGRRLARMIGVRGPLVEGRRRPGNAVELEGSREE